MNWKVEFNAGLQRMELTYKGLNSAKDIIISSHKNILLSKEKGITRFYVDARKLKLNAEKTELFELPSKLYEKWGMDPSTRIAILEPKDKDAKWKADFYILATQNLGWHAKMFSNEKDAMAWLWEK
ncbi:MAG: hypothetical protein WBM77_05265 [Maribacter sp.]